MMTGGLSQDCDKLEGVPVILARGLKQLQAFDVLTRENIVLAPLTAKAVSYSWSGIRSGIAEIFK